VVLVVDDVRENLEVIRSVLEPSGYDVACAGSVDEAMQMARRSPPDLILSDIHMPRASGFRFIEQIQGDSRLASIPFIFISSSMPDRAERRIAEAASRRAVMVRPLDPETLIALIEQELALSRSVPEPEK
jgi:CheY-like chemotaxis protein